MTVGFGAWAKSPSAGYRIAKQESICGGGSRRLDHRQPNRAQVLHDTAEDAFGLGAATLNNAQLDFAHEVQRAGEHGIVVSLAVATRRSVRRAGRSGPRGHSGSPKGLARRRLLMGLGLGVEGLEFLARHPADYAVHQRGWRIHILGDSSSDLGLCQPPPLLALQARALLCDHCSDES